METNNAAYKNLKYDPVKYSSDIILRDIVLRVCVGNNYLLLPHQI